MLAKIFSGTTVGLDGVLIEVEVDVAGRGFPNFTIVGLPNKAIDEAKDRVRTAILNSSFEMPDSRLTINLAPADIPKRGSAYDLPIAIGILVARGDIKRNKLEKAVCIGELSLQGSVRAVPGILSIAMMAKEKNMECIYVPRINAAEAALVKGIIVYPIDTLTQLVMHLNDVIPILSYKSENQPTNDTTFLYDFADIKGQESAKRALEIAAAGFHNIHLKGVPGAGKTLLSRTFSSILPPLDYKSAIEVTKIYSVIGLLEEHALIWSSPFRSPHHTTSHIGLIGGGSTPRPGEITLAHNGILFLDEFPEFSRASIEALRQPMEDGTVVVVRAAGTLVFPARFLLLAASNPCPCGYLGHPTKPCLCSQMAILNYQKKISGPIMDRIDLHIHVPPVAYKQLTEEGSAESSSAIRQRVIEARKRQQERFNGSKIRTNSEMSIAHIKNTVTLSKEAHALLQNASEKLSLSARSYYKVIKISQTIADLTGEEEITANAVAESLQYRPREL